MFGEDRLHRLDVVGVDVVHERPGQQLLRVYPPCPLSASWTASTPSRGAACATYRTAAGPARTRQPAASGIAGTSKWYAANAIAGLVPDERPPGWKPVTARATLGRPNHP